LLIGNTIDTMVWSYGNLYFYCIRTSPKIFIFYDFPCHNHIIWPRDLSLASPSWIFLYLFIQLLTGFDYPTKLEMNDIATAVQSMKYSNFLSSVRTDNNFLASLVLDCHRISRVKWALIGNIYIDNKFTVNKSIHEPNRYLTVKYLELSIW